MSFQQVAVVIVNYNSASKLQRCLDSVTSESVIEVVVVDNASTQQREQEKLEKLAERDKRLRTRFLNENIGFGAGINLAVSLVSENISHLLILNPDAWFAESGLEKMLQTCSLYGDRAVIGPKILNVDRTCWFDGADMDIFAGRVRHKVYTQGGPPCEEEDFLPATALLLSRSQFVRLGGFREDLFMYWEDVALSFTARSRGVPLVLARTAIMYHEAGSSSNLSGSERKSLLWHYYMNRNRLRVGREAGASTLGLLIGRGAFTTMQFLALAVRDENGLRKLFAALRGILAGVFWEPTQSKWIVR